MLLSGFVAPMVASKCFIFGQCTGSFALFALIMALRCKINMKTLSTLLNLLQTITARVAAQFGSLQQTGIKGDASRPSYTHHIIRPVSWLDLCYPLSVYLLSVLWYRLHYVWAGCENTYMKRGKGQLFNISLRQEKDKSVSANIYNACLFGIGFRFHLVCNSLVGPQKPVSKSLLCHTRKVKLTS